MSSVKTNKDRPINWYTIVMLTWVHGMAIYALTEVTWQGVVAFAAMYMISVLGITFGFHRLFTHRTFKTSKPMEYIWAFLGTLAMQGNIRDWVAHHRMHHAGADTANDPHDASKGFWYSHLFWMLKRNMKFDDEKVMQRYSRDIAADPFLRFLGSDAVALAIQVALGIAFFLIWGWSVVLWGIFLRLVAVYHVTWLVNSACHKWGYKNYPDIEGDLSRNCWWVGILALGEGWHNNHHAHQHVAYHRQHWWEVDLTGLVIQAFARLGLIWDVKVGEKREKPAPRKAPAMVEAQPAVSTGPFDISVRA